MIKIIFILLFIFLFCTSLTFRFILRHPFLIIKNAIIDIYDYFKHKIRVKLQHKKIITKKRGEIVVNSSKYEQIF